MVQLAAYLAALLGAYLWMSIPGMEVYALQGFALGILGFFAAKFFHWQSSSGEWQLEPRAHSLELPTVFFSVILMIWNTGHLASPLFPLYFLLLFGLALWSSQLVALATTGGVLLLLIATSTWPLTSVDFSHLLSLPLLMTIFLFTRREYFWARREGRRLIKQTTRLEEHTDRERRTLQFFESFLLPKLEFLRSASEEAGQNRLLLSKQLELLIKELEKVKASF
jgi:hypothetical protein